MAATLRHYADPVSQGLIFVVTGSFHVVPIGTDTSRSAAAKPTPSVGISRSNECVRKLVCAAGR